MKTVFVAVFIAAYPVAALSQSDSIPQPLEWVWSWYGDPGPADSTFDPDSFEGLQLSVSTSENFPFRMYAYDLSAAAKVQLEQGRIPVLLVPHTEPPADVRNSDSDRTWRHIPVWYVATEKSPPLTVLLSYSEDQSARWQILANLRYTRCYATRRSGESHGFIFSESGLEGSAAFRATTPEQVYDGLNRLIADLIANFDWIKASEPPAQGRR